MQFSLLLLAASALASGAKIVEGRIEAMPEDGTAWILKVGPDAVPVAAEKRTRFWLKKAPCEAKAFHVGDLVVARIAPDETPAALREIADKESWSWLEGIRKGVAQGTVKGFDGKHLTMALADGTEMPYRATEKTKITLDGKPATLGDLKAGQKLWLKGRTLPTLDVWLVLCSDHAIVEAPKKSAAKKTGGKRAAKALKLPAAGKIEGDIFLHQQGMGMFDLELNGEFVHVFYSPATAFTYGGAKCGNAELIHGRRATAFYRKDAYGRLVASKVEIR